MTTKRYFRGLGIVVAAAAMLGSNVRIAAGATLHSADHGFSVTSPDGWVAIPHNLLEQNMAFIGSLMNVPQRIHWVAEYQRPARDWFRYPNQLVGYMEYAGGTQPTDGQIADMVNAMMGLDLHDVIKRGNSPILSKVALGEKVDSVDWLSDKHELVFTMHVNVATWGMVKEYNTVYFGNKNMVFLGSCATDDQYDALLPTFQKSADSFQFDPGFAYDTTLVPVADGPSDLMIKIGMICVVAFFATVWFIWKVANIQPKTAAHAATGVPLGSLNTAPPPKLPLPKPPPVN